MLSSFFLCIMELCDSPLTCFIDLCFWRSQHSFFSSLVCAYCFAVVGTGCWFIMFTVVNLGQNKLDFPMDYVVSVEVAIGALW